MAEMTPTIRKNLRSLDNPVELRELNRQLEWIWRMILGGLTMKSFAKGSIGEITKTVEHVITEDIVADNIDVKELKAAIAEIMYADIGILKTDFAKIRDLIADMVIVGEGVAKKYFIDELQVTDANVVNLSADKITGGTLDVGKVDAVNGNFAVITAGMINGHMIAPGTYLADDLRVGSEDDVLVASGGCVNFDAENNIEAVKDKHQLGSAIGDGFAARQHRLKDKSETEKYELLHNSPSTTHFSWKNLVIEYDGIDYAVNDGSTNGSYIYWLKDYPHQLYASNRYLVLSEEDCLLYINKNGIAVTVPGAKTIDGSLIVSGTVHADAIAANAITADKIAAYAIQAGMIASKAVKSDKIDAGAILAEHISAGAVTADKILAGAILADKIGAGAIKGASLDVVDILANSAFIATLVANEGFVGSLVGGNIFATEFMANSALINKIFAEKILSNGSLTISDAFDSMSEELNAATEAAGEAFDKATSAEDKAVSAESKANTANTNAGNALSNAATANANASDALDEAMAAQGQAESAQNAADTAEAAAKATRDELKQYLHFDTSSGLIVGSKDAGEVRIKNGKIDMAAGGEVFSTFGAGYLDLGGDVRIRAPKVGGIVFSPIRG